MSNNSKIESNIIECKNCRQGILADKMFLHEGFCLRNNAYCEHCEKVFLKKDYDEHVKTISNSQTKKTDSQPQRKKRPETLSKNQKPKPENEFDNSLNNIDINENENDHYLYVQIKAYNDEISKLNDCIEISKKNSVDSENNEKNNNKNDGDDKIFKHSFSKKIFIAFIIIFLFIIAFLIFRYIRRKNIVQVTDYFNQIQPILK